MLTRRQLIGSFIGTVACWPFAALYKPKYMFNIFVRTDKGEIVLGPKSTITLENSIDFNKIRFHSVPVADSLVSYNVMGHGLAYHDTVMAYKDNFHPYCIKPGDTLTIDHTINIPKVSESVLRQWLRGTRYINRSIYSNKMPTQLAFTEDIYDDICRSLNQKVLE